jgi:peptide-methionine (S)-S-oxide reductase
LRGLSLRRVAVLSIWAFMAPDPPGKQVRRGPRIEYELLRWRRYGVNHWRMGFLFIVFFLACGLVRPGFAQVRVPDFAGHSDTRDTAAEQTAVLAGGCFWGVDATFAHVKGVSRVVSGYSGGEAKTAEYETVSTGTTGHAESVEIIYDPKRISYSELLRIFFSVAHDPTELNRQGPDTGTQYRSVIFFANGEQKTIAQAYIDQLDRAGVFPRPIVTQVVPLKHFYPAEEYHQNYLERHPDNPYIVFNDLPKLDLLKQEFPQLYKP